MADVDHLERMGRELRCPICLSLMTSPSSLICNHTFCNCCILNVMKARANCPVCEVPFRRREIRPAPHMENLINIFRSMEAAAGLNIFTTQPAPSHKKSAEDEANIETGKGHLGFKTSIKQKESTCNSKVKELNEVVASGDSQTTRVPSFPSKKRVHVTPFLVSETPSHSKKLRRKPTGQNSEPEKDRDPQIDAHVKFENSNLRKPDCMKGQSNPVLSPFFWLRDDIDPDEAAGNTYSQQTCGSDMTEPIVPSFSDIKDSYNNSSMHASPVRASPGKQNFDSEMFEWTQRECSPELFSTPTIKASNKGRQGSTLEDLLVEGSHKQTRKEGCGMHKGKEKGSKSTKGKREISRRIQRKTGKARKPRGLVLQKVHSDEPAGLTENPIQRDTSTPRNELGTCSISKSRKKPKKEPKASFENNRVIEQNPVCNQLKEGFEQNKNTDSTTLADKSLAAVPEDLSPQSCKGVLNTGAENDQSNIASLVSCQHVEEHETLKSNGRTVLANIPETHTQKDQIVVSKRLKRKTEHTDLVEVSGSGKDRVKTKTVGASVKEKLNDTKGWKKFGTLKRCMEPIDGENVSLLPCAVGRLEARHNQIQETEQNATRNSVDMVENFQTDKKQLEKCNAAQFKCVFCRSSNDTEISGQMLHYLNGKPMDVKYDIGIEVIHAHRYCTEWAPNVYFEDDIAVNLKSEVARSKRIKCSQCGIKGAALGCYDKNCRRSFHFTCAKSIGCRFDYGNFVMLCPHHLASKLPNESATNLEGSHGSKLNSKRNTCREAICQVVKTDPTEKPWTSDASTYKWLLCCSALNPTDKEVVSEFTKLSGVKVSKLWNPNVTHVVAGIDENGACKRTLKVLMAIIEGKWILSIDWLKACLRARKHIEEDSFEIRVDNHGTCDGPRLGRSRILEKKPKLFAGFKFYFMGEYTASYKGYLLDLVTAAGATVLQRKPISRDMVEDSAEPPTYIIYSRELPDKQIGTKVEEIIAHRKNEAVILAATCGVLVADNTWILDSISASKVLKTVD